MNWLQKIATPLKTSQWQKHTQKSIESLVPGEWDRSWDEIDFKECSFIGKEIMIKPNSLFYVNITMKRRTWGVYEMDSAYGNKDITFECYVKASPKNQWPTFGKVIGYTEMLDTPFEIAKFVQNSIQNYNPNEEGDNVDPEPEMPPAPTENVPVLMGA